MPRARVLAARWLLVDAHHALPDAGLIVRDGRVERVLRSPAAVARAERATGARAVRHDGALTAGLVNAHAHLELSGLAGQLCAGAPMLHWVRDVLAARAQRSGRELERDARRGARRCLATGTTCVGDVDSTGAGERALRGGPLRVVLYREALDAGSAERGADVLAALRRRLPPRARRLEGLSPHAPHTCSPALLRALGELASRRRLPIAVHWAETPEERAWLARGEGPFAPLLGASPGAGGLELLARAKLLGSRTALVHGNEPERGDPARVAAAGASVVHCPGSHAFFARAPFPLARYRRAGCALALGTDSLASNADLDLRREMRLARAALGLAPADAWMMATAGGARALGLGRLLGTLAPGRAADAVLFASAAPSAAALLEELTSALPPVEAVWIGGRQALRASARPEAS